MSEIKTVYRSTHPDVVAFWAEVKRRHEGFTDAKNAFLATLPEGCEGVVTNRHGKQLVGVAADTTPGDLWQQKRGEWWWSPIRKSAAGKRLAKQVDAIRWSTPDVPGMPQIVVDFPSIYHPTPMPLNGEFWCVWGTPVELVEACPSFDATIWTRAKLSEYYAAQEAREAAEAAEAQAA